MILATGFLLFAGVALAATGPDFPSIDDTPREIGLHTPEWFELSFLDFGEDLERAVERGKNGLSIYFGMDDCPYCEAMIHENLAQPDIEQYFSDHFDVIALDVQGSRDVVTLDGEVMSERNFAVQRRLNFTPAFTFFDAEGNEIHRIRGYYPPYRFRAALEYVIDRHDREGSFREYLERADPPPKFDVDDINERDFFQNPPHMLDRSRIPAQRPLVVFFERRACHACDVLHSEPLQDDSVLDLIELFDAVQLDLDAETPVITPDGERTTAEEWGRALDIHWAPTMVFFDERGREVIRIDSVVALTRLRNVMNYVLTRAYEEYPTFERWRAAGAE
ncbi:thioredoxin SoxW [Thioalkalivibrio nitratireducens DSM 14787]|uniref:Thioredoxin SoxW n=2 Tax=Thioalkalivibrio nitratireducens TaxID=186931 RepID=L0DXL4_THIND|nr:thioredoxin fold domain-containing protein [Thioalkalivibrio nitratireducens]AGA33783.1 thioredoxin SoxW [Thioalkalivibrio nitratireducens DSM 14787]